MTNTEIFLGLLLLTSIVFTVYYLFFMNKSYKYYKLLVRKIRSEGNCLADVNSCVQISEFILMDNNQRLDTSKVIATSKEENNTSHPNNNGNDQSANRAFDNDKNTKWLDFNYTNELLFEFDKPVKATHYTWITANDVPNRDPISWTLSGSNDNANWTVLSTVDDYKTTMDRYTQVNTFELSP